MNVFISVRLFQIIIENTNIEKFVKNIIDSKLMFCKKHNFMLYLKSIIELKNSQIEELKNSNTNSNFDESNDFLKMENSKKKDF